jgi:5-(carboxyamino)imidazole ribonucleotide synthase
VSVAAPVLEPGATIGILGSGQLGRMLALAAARLGFKCHIFAPDRDSPAFDVVRESTRAGYDDEQALARFAESVDVVTYEFENIPAETAAFLAPLVPVLPDPRILATTQDRRKRFHRQPWHRHRALCGCRHLRRIVGRARAHRSSRRAENATLRL